MEYLKHSIGVILVVVAVGLIAVVGHRHWLPTTTPTPTVIEHPGPMVIEQPQPAPEEPVVVEQPKPKKPVKKPVKKPAPKKTEPKKPAPKPAPTPRRECDASGWCWTTF